MQSTSFLAKLIGLMLLFVGSSIAFQKETFLRVLNDLTSNRTSLFMVGVALLVAGLSVVLAHNIWNEGALSVAITLIGWILILRGVASMFVPGVGIARLMQRLKVAELSWFYASLVLLIGACLTWAGFRG